MIKLSAKYRNQNQTNILPLWRSAPRPLHAPQVASVQSAIFSIVGVVYAMVFTSFAFVEVIAVMQFLDRGVKPQLPNRSSRHRSDDTSLRFYTGFINRNDELQWISTRSSTICPTKHHGCYPMNRHEWRCYNQRASQSQESCMSRYSPPPICGISAVILTEWKHNM